AGSGADATGRDAAAYLRAGSVDGEAARSLRRDTGRTSGLLPHRVRRLQLRQRRQRPVDGGLAAAHEVLVGLGEVSAAEEAAMRRQRRGMRGAQHAVAAGVDDAALLLRVA